MRSYKFRDGVLYLEGAWTKTTLPLFYKELIADLREQTSEIRIDGSGLVEIDSAGVALIDEIIEMSCQCPVFSSQRDDVTRQALSLLVNFSEVNLKKVHIFTVQGLPPESLPQKENLLLRLGEYLYAMLASTFEMIVLTSDIFYWSLVGLWDRKGQRKGSFTQQVNLIGINALPIVGLLSFIIGLILALQSAIQLRSFGADQFLADLLAFSMVRELSPLITSIILAGRSGSAIAAEIATMKVTEELDALKMMALNPIRYVIVPKFHAVTLSMSLLVIFSIIISIMGGMLVAITISGQSASAFISACFEVIDTKDLLLTLVKSTVFAWQIVIIGSHYGFGVQGGAEGVGKATTAAVVSSIFSVIIMDALFSFIYLV